jgi:hypothetical protein
MEKEHEYGALWMIPRSLARARCGRVGAARPIPPDIAGALRKRRWFQSLSFFMRSQRLPA